MRITIRLKPGSSRTRIHGWEHRPDSGLVLVASVAAPPIDGRANAMLIRLLADTLAIARADLRISHGLASRTKIVELPDGTRLDALGSPPDPTVAG